MTHLDFFSVSVGSALSVALFLGEFLLDFSDFSALLLFFSELAKFLSIVAESATVVGAVVDIGGVLAVVAVAELTTDSEEVAGAGVAVVELVLLLGVGFVDPAGVL